jgi:ubiquinone/menaquinone biosynthesis C-methylase UbiE
MDPAHVCKGLKGPMSFYNDRILPYLIDRAMRQETLDPYRRRVVSAAVGRVLEIGIGSGLNLPRYARDASLVIGLDPAEKSLGMATQAGRTASVRVALIGGSAEEIPIDDRSIDCVVTTWTLCTIPNVEQAIAETRRVLKPDGSWLFAEHGRSPDPGVLRWQNLLTPIWRRIGGGCHLNRPIRQLIEDAGFRIERLDTGYMKGPKPMTFMYEGVARIR